MVDGGNLYWKSSRLTTQERPQQQEKARLMATAVQASGIDAMLLAEGDVALGVDFVKGLADELHLPYVATNVDCGGGFPAKQLVIERSGLQVGVLGAVNDRASFTGCTATDPHAAIRDGVAALQAAGVDVIVLLDALAEEPSEGLLKAVPGIDLVVGGTLQPLQSPDPAPGGGLQLGPGTRGRDVGVLTFTLVEGATAWREDSTAGRLAEQRDRYNEKVAQAKADAAKANGEKDKAIALRRADYYAKLADDAGAQLKAATAVSERAHSAHNTLVTLDTAVKDDAATQALVDAAKARINALVSSSPSGPVLGPYVGSAACAGCHAAETAQWRGTAHARAWASLVEKKRQLDQACFSCHATGAVPWAGDVLGPHAPGEVGSLANVGCESCHGPGKDHLANPATAMAAPTSATCVACHDATQDEGRFDFPTYLPRVSHAPAAK